MSSGDYKGSRALLENSGAKSVHHSQTKGPTPLAHTGLKII